MTLPKHKIQNQTDTKGEDKDILKTRPPPICIPSSSNSVSSITHSVSSDSFPTPKLSNKTPSHPEDDVLHKKDSRLFEVFATLCLSGSIVYLNPFYMNVLLTYLMLVSITHEKSNVKNVITDEVQKFYTIWKDFYKIIKMKLKT